MVFYPKAVKVLDSSSIAGMRIRTL
jgi:hypothetical protein